MQRHRVPSCHAVIDAVKLKTGRKGNRLQAFACCWAAASNCDPAAGTKFTWMQLKTLAAIQGISATRNAEGQNHYRLLTVPRHSTAVGSEPTNPCDSQVVTPTFCKAERTKAAQPQLTTRPSPPAPKARVEHKISTKAATATAKTRSAKTSHCSSHTSLIWCESCQSSHEASAQHAPKTLQHQQEPLHPKPDTPK
jgi:hypothetical protein